MKNYALSISVFLLVINLQAQKSIKVDSILANCPCSTKNLLRAQKHAKYLWENGWIIKIKCNHQSYFFQTKKAYATHGKLLVSNQKFKGRAKITFKDHKSFGVSLPNGFIIFYRFTEEKWSAKTRPYLPYESMGTHVR